jgi:hypothetical protein
MWSPIYNLRKYKNQLNLFLKPWSETTNPLVILTLSLPGLGTNGDRHTTPITLFVFESSNDARLGPDSDPWI